MKNEANAGISFFQRYLTVWVFLCMVAGVLLGYLAPALPAALDQFTYARVSIPMAILIWVMIYPMMLKVDFQSIRGVGKNPKGLLVTWVTNWLIKPFTMYGIASLFFFVLFKGFIAPELAREYLAGAVLLGAAPSRTAPARYSVASSGAMNPLNATKKNRLAMPYMENGLMSQLVTQVTNSPLGFFPTLRMLWKSTFSIIGYIITQIRIAMGMDTRA